MQNLLRQFSINNVFAGFIVAVVALPLCIAFAIASGANPMAGVVSGVVGGFIAAVFGSSKFQVSGPAAAFITIIYGIIAQHGFPVLLAATFVSGIVVLAIAALRLGKVMELMPHSVIVGFTTGIGIVILLGQLPIAFGIDAKGQDIVHKLINAFEHRESGNLYELLVVAVTLVGTLIYARTKAARWVPPPLVALLIGVATAQALAANGIEVRTIGALYDVSISSLSASAGFLETMIAHARPILMAGFTLGFLIAVESLLSSKALDAMTNTTHNPDRELVGLGLANLAVPFVGGIPVSGVIVRGSTNVMSGGTERSAALLHAVFLGLFVVALYGAIKILPMAALAAVLMMTARRLIEWHEVKRIAHIDRVEGALVVLTVVLTVTVDLTVSVPLGVVLMLLIALKRMLEDTRVDIHDEQDHAVVAVNNSLTFLTSSGLKREIEHHIADERVRALNLTGMHCMDATGAMMVAEVMGRNERIKVWVSDAAAQHKLAHAGVDESRIRLVGNRLVNLPAVFRQLEKSAA